MDDKARTDKEMESLIPKEEKKSLKGVCLDFMLHWSFWFVHKDV